MTERDALLAAIAEHPDDDTPRLAFADWLDEHGEHAEAHSQRRTVYLSRITRNPDDDGPRLDFATWLDEQEYPLLFASPCEKCGGERSVFGPTGLFEADHSGWIDCPACRGAGTVTQNIDALWAEFIRVQVELARLDSPVPNTDHVHGLAVRDRELFRTLEPVLRRGAECGTCGGNWRTVLGHSTVEVNGKWACCPACRGVGWLGSLAEYPSRTRNTDGSVEYDWRVDAEWRRGFPWKVSCPLDYFRREVGQRFEAGDGRQSRHHRTGIVVGIPWAAALFAEWGMITRVEFTDLSGALPQWLAPTVVSIHGVWSSAAYDAMSAVAVAWGKEQATCLVAVS